MGSVSVIAKKMRRRSVEREEMAKNTPHEAHKRVPSVFGFAARVLSPRGRLLSLRRASRHVALDLRRLQAEGSPTLFSRECEP